MLNINLMIFSCYFRISQPIFSSSILAEMMKSDGSSSIPIVDGDYVPAVLAHEIMGIQVFICIDWICILDS